MAGEDGRQHRYARLAAELADRIRDGRLPEGSPLPSEAELGAEYGMSRGSVRNAMRLLRGWGLVRVDKGRGAFVRRPRRRVRRHATERYRQEKQLVRRPEYERRLSGAVEMDTGLPHGQVQHRIEFDEVDAPPRLAHVFGIAPGTKLLRRRYHESDVSDGHPIRTGYSYLVHDVVAVNPDLLNAGKEPWPGGTMHQLSTIGIEVDRIVDEVTARPPMPEEAEVLGIDEGVSVLCLRKISIDTAGQVVEVSEIVMPGDRTELVYTTELPRWDATS